MEQLHDFYCGTMFQAYEYFGAHPGYKDNQSGVWFRVYAPGAKSVQVIGDFNGWNGDWMYKDTNSGVYVCFLTTPELGQLYKYRIWTRDGRTLDKSDPYGFGMELRPNSASMIVDLNGYIFTDQEWMNQREKNYNKPMNIYEIHAGSWRRKEEGEKGWYKYHELSELLIPYLKENNYTHVELLPLAEHPADCSWGYQITGFYAPTSRYGTAKDLMEFVNQCHLEGICVIMDFVPVHFAIDDYGLGQFDGTALYEYPSGDTGHSQWGTYGFNYYRGEICSFLQSSADYWLNIYHMDGLRMDAINNVIYWKGNKNCGVNEGGLNFLKRMNLGLHKRYPNVMLIAEDSSDYLKVTAPVEYGGLGFDYKWDMGFMNDTLDFFKKTPKERSEHYHMLTFSMHYFYNELFLLAFSHDENVHGKATILQKMWGEYEYKFPQARVLYTYMYTHPGKKLNFMGNEIGHFREWDESREMDWGLLNYPLHESFLRYMKELSRLYQKTFALYEGEYHPEKFRWIEADAVAECVYIYERKSEQGNLLILLNLSDQIYQNYCFGYDKPMIFERVLNSDSEEFGGTDTSKSEQITFKKGSHRDWQYSSVTNLAPFSAKIFAEAQTQKKKKEDKDNEFI